MNPWNMSKDALKNKDGYHTAKEICQQPETWEKSLKILAEQKYTLQAFVQPLLAKPNLRIIFTGAGTSAYVGDTIAPYLREKTGRDIWSIATTDIVAAPQMYLRKDVPTVLVSFARSGDSPESVGAFDLAEQLVFDIHQLVITCNAKGALAQRVKTAKHAFCLLTPSETNDLGFAMTSSFTNMLLMGLNVFDLQNLDKNSTYIQHIIECVKSLVKGAAEATQAADLGRQNFSRIVYLGSGSFKGLAQETRLKVLELTGGRIAAMSEGVMGFRHGPKSILSDDTLVIMLLSSNPYIHKYDMDFLRELRHDEKKFKVLTIASAPDAEVQSLSDVALVLDMKADKPWGEDAYLALGYVVFGQILALAASMHLGVTPDNPCPSGSVNRVVKGVTIHPWKK